jgi:hypothetical protein
LKYILHDAVNMVVEKKESILKLIDEAADGKLTLEDMKAFWYVHRDLPDLTEERASQAFEYIDTEGKGHLDLTDLEHLINGLKPPHYRCVEITGLSDSLQTDGTTKITYQVDKGDILEGLEEPVRLESGVVRVKVKMIKNQKVGWTALIASSGKKFLEKLSDPIDFLNALDEQFEAKVSGALERRTSTSSTHYEQDDGHSRFLRQGSRDRSRSRTRGRYENKSSRSLHCSSHSGLDRKPGLFYKMTGFVQIGARHNRSEKGGLTLCSGIRPR